MVRKALSPEELAQREETLVRRYGSAENLAAKRKEWQAKSRVRYVENGSKGGFRGISEERLREISKLGNDAQKNQKADEATA